MCQAIRSAGTGLQLAFNDAGTMLLCAPVSPWASPGPSFPPAGDSWFSMRSMAFPTWIKKASQRLVAAKIVWHRLKKDVRDWANTCVVCQRAKVHHHKAPRAHFPVPERRFNDVHMDMVGPLPPFTSSSSQWLTGPHIGRKLSRCHQRHPPRQLGLRFS